MALGSNIEYKAKALFQAALDEKSAKQVEDRFVKLSKEASEMSRAEFVAAFSSLGDEINKAFKKFQLPELDMKQILKNGNNADAFKQFGIQLGNSLNEGIDTVLLKNGSIDKLLEIKRRELENSSLYKTTRRASAVQHLTGIGKAYNIDTQNMHIKDFSNMETENISQYMDALYANIEQTLVRLKGIDQKADPKKYTGQFIALENMIATYIEGIGGLSNILELSNNPKYNIDALRTLTSRHGFNTKTWDSRSSSYQQLIEKQQGSVEYTQMIELISVIQQLETQSQFATKSIQDINNAIRNLQVINKL